MEANALRRPTNLTTLISKRAPQFLNFTSLTTLLNPRNKPVPLFLTQGSTKPNANKQTTADENPSSIPNSITQSKPTIFSSSSSSSRGLIFDLGPENSWDSLEIGSPVVKRYVSDDEERWYMWYHGRSSENPNLDSIGLAVSSNGVHWDRGERVVASSSDVGLVMSSSTDWWAFDTHSIRPSEAVLMSSAKVRANRAVYWLYYTGFSSEKIDSLDESLDKYGRINLKSLPGLAMSQDGRHWARIEGEHHSGALLDVGSNGEWDSLFIASPQVVFHETGDLRMYYHSFDVENGKFAVGIARSRDGMRWVKLGKILSGGDIGGFDEFGIVNPCVVRNREDGKYVMVYEGVGENEKRSIGCAVSGDGLKDWKKVDYNPVLEESEDCGWDCEGVGMPCLVEMDGNREDCWRLYYRGIGKAGRSGIGLAVSRGREFKNFERWIGFHL